jgi:hypothetical protein
MLSIFCMKPFSFMIIIGNKRVKKLEIIDYKNSILLNCKRIITNQLKALTKSL